MLVAVTLNNNSWNVSLTESSADS